MNSFNESWFQNKTKEEVIKQISELRKNIKKKHRSLKRNIMESEEFLEKQFKPLSDPLKKLLEESGRTSELLEEEKHAVDEKVRGVKRKVFRSNSDYDGESETSSPIKRFTPTPVQGMKRKQKINFPTKPDYESDYDYDHGNNDIVHVTKRPAVQDVLHGEDKIMDVGDIAGSSVSEDEENMETENQNITVTTTPRLDMRETVYESPVTGEQLLKTPEGRHLAKEYVRNKFNGKLAKEYFSKLISGNKEIDHNYGVRVEGDYWMLGNKVLEIDNDDLIISDKRYSGTRGLYELIFMNQPNEFIYSEKDMNDYKSILFDTNVFRTNYSTLGKVRSNRGRKYKYIIAQLINQRAQPMMESYVDVLPGGASGSGMTLSNAQPNVIYYDDPNEIINRLRLLLGSQESGNTGHENEINAIMEELNEQKYELLKQINTLDD